MSGFTMSGLTIAYLDSGFLSAASSMMEMYSSIVALMQLLILLLLYSSL
jgi:hypothetical protein